MCLSFRTSSLFLIIPRRNMGYQQLSTWGWFFNFLKNREKHGVGMLNDAEFVLWTTYQVCIARSNQHIAVASDNPQKEPQQNNWVEHERFFLMMVSTCLKTVFFFLLDHFLQKLKPQDLTRWGVVCALDRVGQLPHLNFESFSSTRKTSHQN